jgi:uncharacterized protein (TIGR00369 family)
MPESDPAAEAVPAGYTPLDTGGPYFRALGPMFARRRDDGLLVVALRVGPSHLNMQGVAHGGMLSTLADGALGINIALARGVRGPQATVSLTMDFVSAARLGDWLEAEVTVTRMGRTLAYASCALTVAAKPVLRSSAVFAFLQRPLSDRPDAATSFNDG